MNDATSNNVNLHDYCVQPRSTEEKLEAALQRIAELEDVVQQQTVEQFGISRFTHDSELTRFYTGFQTYEVFRVFLKALLHMLQK